MRNPVLCCLFWLGWSLGGLWPKGDVRHVCDLPVVKIVLLLIFSENDYMYFICCFVRLWGGACNLIKFMITTARGWLCFLQYPAQLSLTWSGEVNLPINGVSLYLQNWVDLNYYIRFVVLWLASVLSRCLEKYWGGNVFDLGTEDGPSVHTKISLNLVLLLAP